MKGHSDLLNFLTWSEEDMPDTTNREVRGTIPVGQPRLWMDQTYPHSGLHVGEPLMPHLPLWT